MFVRRVFTRLRDGAYCISSAIISDPASTEANKVFDAFVKDIRKKGNIAGVGLKKAISKDRLKKLFYSGKLGAADSYRRLYGSASASFLKDGDVKTSDS